MENQRPLICASADIPGDAMGCCLRLCVCPVSSKPNAVIAAGRHELSSLRCCNDFLDDGCSQHTHVAGIHRRPFHVVPLGP